MENLVDVNLDRIVEEFSLERYRAKQLAENVLQFKSYDEMSNVPKAVRQRLAESGYCDRALEVTKHLISRDGSQKYLFTLNDNNTIEGVFIANNYGNTLCVSTQVGCRMGCAFCLSTEGGLVRNLTGGEILSQILAVNRLNGGSVGQRAVANIVMMGMGEPLDNFDNVKEFLRKATDEEGMNISIRNISLSTVGIPDKIRQLAEFTLNPTLAISLHFGNDELRNKYIPISVKYPIKEIMAAAEYYFEKTGRRVVFEYALISGVNVDKESARQITALIKGKPYHINLIPLNQTKENGLSRAKQEEITEFMQTLKQNNISATLRRSVGGDINGACGQLRRKFVGCKDTTYSGQKD